MTAKQTLSDHLRDMHPRADRTGTLATLQARHALQHYRYYVNHYHAGTNLGVDNRPEGWYTGKDAVERT